MLQAEHVAAKLAQVGVRRGQQLIVRKARFASQCQALLRSAHASSAAPALPAAAAAARRASQGFVGARRGRTDLWRPILTAMPELDTRRRALRPGRIVLRAHCREIISRDGIEAGREASEN